MRIVVADPELPVDPLHDATVDVDCNLCNGTGERTAPRTCQARSRSSHERCSLLDGHQGLHRDRRFSGFTDAVWPEGVA